MSFEIEYNAAAVVKALHTFELRFNYGGYDKEKHMRISVGQEKILFFCINLGKFAKKYLKNMRKYVIIEKIYPTG